MIKTKVRLYGKDGKAQVAIKFKATKKQPVEVSQIELLAILLGYRDVVLKDYSNFAAIQHIRETVDLMEKEMAANKEVKQDD
mgnify:CR=1 FL=1